MPFFDYSFLSPTLVAYVMGGHVGGSWANTADRIVGLVSGMLCAYFFLIFTECNTYALGSTFCLVSMLSFYVRVSSKVIPTPSHLLDRIWPISSPKIPVFCAFSPSRRGVSN